MAALDYPTPIQRLIGQFKALPGIGPRSAERLVLWLLANGQSHVTPLAEALRVLETDVEMCDDCGFYSQRGSACVLCASDKRSKNVLCVV